MGLEIFDGLIEYPMTIMGGSDDLITCASNADPTAPLAATKLTPALPGGCTVTQAYIVMQCRAIQDDSSAGNYVATAGAVQVKKVSGGAWVTGIVIPTGAWDVNSNSWGEGCPVVGEIDVKAQVVHGAQVQFQIVDLRAQGSNIVMHDVQFGL